MPIDSESYGPDRRHEWGWRATPAGVRAVQPSGDVRTSESNSPGQETK